MECETPLLLGLDSGSRSSEYQLEQREGRGKSNTHFLISKSSQSYYCDVYLQVPRSVRDWEEGGREEGERYSRWPCLGGAKPNLSSGNLSPPPSPPPAPVSLNKNLSSSVNKITQTPPEIASDFYGEHQLSCNIFQPELISARSKWGNSRLANPGPVGDGF